MPRMPILIVLACLGTLPASGKSPQAGAQPPHRAAQSAPAANPPSEPAARAQAEVARNLQAEAGRRYADSAAAAAAGPLAAAAQACRDSLAAGKDGKAQVPTDSAYMEVYLMLSRRGMVKAFAAHPQGELEACLSRRAPATLALPAPPGPNYWIRVGMGKQREPRR